MKLLGGILKGTYHREERSCCRCWVGSRPSGIRQCFKIDRGWQLHSTHGNCHGKTLYRLCFDGKLSTSLIYLRLGEGGQEEALYVQWWGHHTTRWKLRNSSGDAFQSILFAFYVNQMSELNLPASQSTPHVQKRARSAGTS